MPVSLVLPATFTQHSRSLRLLLLLVAFTGSLGLAQIQGGSRITQPIDDGVRDTLKGNVHPLAQPRYDRGPVPDSFPVERILLILQRSAEREMALRQFLEDVHRPGNTHYHKWLTPAQFGTLYGLDDSELATVSAWLQSHGFAVARVTKAKTAIEFSGSAGQFRDAFNAEIHTYLINGQEHHANNRDPQIPAALAPVVAGITPTNDFRPKPNIEVLGQALYNANTHQVIPEWTSGTDQLVLAPGDFAVQYDLNPLYDAGINGNGVTIGIIGASNVVPSVVANYRSFFGLPAGTLNVVIDGLDPGPDSAESGSNWATLESYLDVEVSGGVAPGATINLYTAADTTVQSGLLLAAQRAVDDDQASILSTSYAECEQDLGSAGNQFWAGLWEQAAAQGQTSLVSSGDAGSAGCDDFGLAQAAQYGLAVNGFSSTQWNVSVGGTDFFYSSYNGNSAAQNAQLATYWNLTPTGTPNTSLLGPIPEQVWNDAFGLNLSSGGVYDPSSPTIVAGSGGASSCVSGVNGSDGSYASCTGGYAKPAWQNGRGVPADGVRDLPDVSLFAANGANYSYYPVCAAADQCGASTYAFTVFLGVGGTSASTPAMAGIMALINQKYGAQGQADYVFYPLAAQHPSAFHDITVGSNNVPCQQGSPSCTLSTLNDNTNGFYTLGRYYAAPGYDQASGLGSVDANLLLQYWSSLTFTPTNTALSLSQTSFSHGTPVSVSVAVTGNGGTPSGDVGLVTSASPAENTGLGELTLHSGGASATLKNLPGGQYQLTATYTGDTVFAPSNSNPVTLNVAPEGSTISLSGSYWSSTSNTFLPLSNGGSYPYGTYIAVDAQPRGVKAPAGSLDGIATGTMTFTDAAGTGTLSSGTLNLNVKGLAEWQPPFAFPAGANSLSASYSGDASFSASTSATPLAFTVTAAAPYTEFNAYPNLIGMGSTTALTLEVNWFSGPPCSIGASCTFAFPFLASPTGTATFSVGSTVIGTAPLVPGGGTGSGNAWAVLNVTSLPLGTDAVTVSYSGDVNYAPATTSVKVTVEQPANLTASANPSSINQAQSTTVSATVARVKGQPVPTGFVTCYLMSYDSNQTCSGNLIDGSMNCAFVDTFFPAGNDPIIVSYSGDTVYAPAQITIPLTVTVSSAVYLSGTSVSIAPGASTGNTSTITVSPYNFVGTVSLSCALASSPTGAQDLPSCSIPPSVNIAAPNPVEYPVTVTMAIISTAPSSSAIIYSLPTRQGRLAAKTGAAMLAMLLFFISVRRRRWRYLPSLALILVLLGGFCDCGGGNGGGGGGITNPGTSPGTYAFTVKASYTATNGPAQTQTTVTVTIQ